MDRARLKVALERLQFEVGVAVRQHLRLEIEFHPMGHLICIPQVAFLVDFLFHAVGHVVIATLRKDDGDVNENVPEKYNFALL